MEMGEMVVQAPVVVVTKTLLVELLRHQVKVIMAEHQVVVEAILREVAVAVREVLGALVMLVLEELLGMVVLDCNLQLQGHQLIMVVVVAELKTNRMEVQELEA
jgi:hypothetical protein